MTNAGATWVDTPVITDGHIVSSRRPPDLPDYMREFIAVLERNNPARLIHFNEKSGEQSSPLFSLSF